MHAKALLRIFVGIGLLIFSAGGLAIAADLPPDPKPPQMPRDKHQDWTGFYLGFNAGAEWGRSNWNAFQDVSFDLSGGLIGLTIGYNFQSGPWVFGIEADMDWTTLEGSSVAKLPN